MDGKLAASETVEDRLCAVISTVGVQHNCGDSLVCPAWPCCHRVEAFRWKNEIDNLSKFRQTWRWEKVGMLMI